MNIKEYLSTRNRNTYEKEHFDSFLLAKKFSFNLPFIHVAGTNGKGSTCYYLAQILMEAGYKVGLFISPYYQDPCETISINGEKITSDEFLSIIKNDEKLIEKYDLSEFEIETYVAFSYFEKNGCDISIIECGMGGLEDATNIATPVLSIITSVSLEHTSFLGKTISEIAKAKSGIIKDEIPLVIPDDLSDEANNVINQEAIAHSSPIIYPDKFFAETINDKGWSFSVGKYQDLHIPSLARTSIKDACFALCALKALEDRFDIKEENVRNGLMKTNIKGRMSVTHLNPFVIVDGAHNPEAIHSLVENINFIKKGEIHIVFSCFTDKNINVMLPELGILTNDIYLTTFNHPRARQEFDYFLYLDEYKYEENHQDLIKKLISSYPDDTILICGSLAFAYLVLDEFERGVYNV